VFAVFRSEDSAPFGQNQFDVGINLVYQIAFRIRGLAGAARCSPSNVVGESRYDANLRHVDGIAVELIAQ